MALGTNYRRNHDKMDRNIAARIAEHAELTRALQAAGVDAKTASALAFKAITTKEKR